MRFQFTLKELLFFTVVIALITWVCVEIPYSAGTWPVTYRRPTGSEIALRLLLCWPPVVIACLMAAWVFRRLMRPRPEDDSEDEDV
jgi:hypothetical protein